MHMHSTVHNSEILFCSLEIFSTKQVPPYMENIENQDSAKSTAGSNVQNVFDKNTR